MYFRVSCSTKSALTNIILAYPADMSAGCRIADADVIVPVLLAHDRYYVAIIQFGIGSQSVISFAGAGVGRDLSVIWRYEALT